MLLLLLNESPLKHIAKETAIPLIIIGIFHISNFLDKYFIDDLHGYTEIFQTTIDLISTNLKIPHLQICMFLEEFDVKESLEFFKNNDFYQKITVFFPNHFQQLDLPLDNVFKNIRKAEFKDFYKKEQLDEFRRGQQHLPPTDKPTLPMNNLHAGILGKVSSEDTPKDTGTRNKNI